MPLSAFATIHPKPEHFDDALAAVRNIVERTRSEAGCIEFVLHTAPDGTMLYLYEVWRDQAALDAHYAQDYTRAVFEQYERWLAQPVAITFMRPVD